MADRLCTVPLFTGLNHDHLTAVAKLVSEFSVGAGHVLIQPRMVGAGLFLIEEGTVMLELQNRNVELGPGEMVGELSLLDDRSVHTSRVKTMTPVSGYCISRDDFGSLLHDEPTIAIPMLHVLAHRLVDLITHH